MTYLYALARRWFRKPLIRPGIDGPPQAVAKGWPEGASPDDGLREILERFAECERANARTHADWLKSFLPSSLRPWGRGDALYRMRETAARLYDHLSLFDAPWYEAEHVVSDLTPIEHFILQGRHAGAAPNPFFDYLGYLVRYPDIVEAGIDPCLHYALVGWREGRDPGLGFQPTQYLAYNPDVAAADMNPLQHFLSSGREQGRDPCPGLADLVSDKPSSLLDPRYATGTIVIVSHDAGVGGAQKLVQSYARWVRDHTAYAVRIVCMETGGLLNDFDAIAPTLVLDVHPPEARKAVLAEFCGGDVRAVFLNSIVSTSFLIHWSAPTPVIGYIHELPKILQAYPDELALLRKRAALVIGGSGPVTQALRDEGFAETQLETQTAFIEARQAFDGPQTRIAAKKALGFGADTTVIAACGVMHWRKAPKVFIDVAERVLAGSGRNVHFLWIGGGPDQEECEALVAEKGLGDRLTITGYTPVVQDHLDAADIFLLPSEEDPFPIVCLMAAQAGVPVICFEEAGGIPGFVAQGCGMAVPFLDAGAMAGAVMRYLGDPALRAAQGSRGAELVAEGYTIEAVGPRLFHLMREAAGRKPAVSVVMPNYNYEAYLPQRLESIAAQGFQDFELILLDDASPDDSAALMRDWAEGRPATRLVVNEANSGSPFIQWIKGMAMAQSDLIWIAEADDFCDPDLLERLLPAFADPTVHLGHARSVPVDAEGAILGDYAALYLDRIAPGRWNASHTVTDHEEANAGLGIANCIPNASGVILRKFAPEPDFAETVSAMRMCGDWLFYLRAMRGGMVAYEAGSTNYHRRHGDTVTARTEGSPLYFDELQSVRDYVARTYRLGDDTRARIENFVTSDLDRFGIDDDATRAHILDATTRAGEKHLPSVLFVLPDLSPGGGQMFVIRMANAWVAGGGRAVLVNVGDQPTHDKVFGHIDPRVAVIREDDPRIGDLARLCARWDIDLIHSAIWWADKYVRGQIEALPDMPWVVTMHGCHETFLAAPDIDPDFDDALAAMKARVDAWVHTTDKNTAIFEATGWPDRHARIANGVPILRRGDHTRAALGLREGAVVLCLASRAIEEKGWFAAVDMTQALNREGYAVDLMLIGEGPARDAIAAIAPDHVHLYGHVGDLHDYIAVCDIGILPSFFVGESMPLVLLEMMGSGKPVVATGCGEIPAMIGAGPDAAGTVVPLLDGDTLDKAAFTEAVRTLVTDPAHRATLGQGARARFDAHYREEDMMARYTHLYEEAIARRQEPSEDHGRDER